MIEFVSDWAKGLTLAVIIISILEMILPNNKTKKYIRMVMGVYLLFTIISPFIQGNIKSEISLSNIEEYFKEQNIETSTQSINQTSMNERIEELYKQEIEKDIKNKLEEKGYELKKCIIDVNIKNEESETKINKITLNIRKFDNNTIKQNIQDKESLEEKVVVQVEKIKEIDTSIENKNKITNKRENSKHNTKITNSEIQDLKNFLKEEYGVEEKCLEIN